MGKVMDWARSNLLKAISLGIILFVGVGILFVMLVSSGPDASANNSQTPPSSVTPAEKVAPVLVLKTDAEIEREMASIIENSRRLARDKAVWWGKELKASTGRMLWTIDGFEIGEKELVDGKLVKPVKIWVNFNLPNRMDKKIRLELETLNADNVRAAGALLKNGAEFSLSFEHTELVRVQEEAGIWMPVFRGWFLFTKVNHEVLPATGTPPSGASSTAGPVVR